MKKRKINKIITIEEGNLRRHTHFMRPELIKV
jgi:hypothetical protein